VQGLVPAEGLGVSPQIICHCEPFSERSKEKAKQSPLPEIAASPPAPRNDRWEGGGQGVEGWYGDSAFLDSRSPSSRGQAPRE
jgi:hypothetical protein